MPPFYCGAYLGRGKVGLFVGLPVMGQYPVTLLCVGHTSPNHTLTYGGTT